MKWMILIGVILLLCVAEWIREIRTFRITHYDIISNKLNGIKKEQTVLFLSDLHNNTYGLNNEKLLQAVKMQQPDFILIGGDMLVGKKGLSLEVAEELILELSKLCPVYYANGNHEFRMKIAPELYGEEFQAYKNNLEKAGVVFLENSFAELNWDGCPVRICGLEIPRECYKKFKKNSFTIEQMYECVGENEVEKYQILLAHNPVFMDTYKTWGADLILSGHLHGGVVRIPKVGGIITPQFSLFPKYSGELTVEGETSIVVSKGLGTHTIKVRFMNPAELIVLHVKGREK